MPINKTITINLIDSAEPRSKDFVHEANLMTELIDLAIEKYNGLSF